MRPANGSIFDSPTQQGVRPCARFCSSSSPLQPCCSSPVAATVATAAIIPAITTTPATEVMWATADTTAITVDTAAITAGHIAIIELAQQYRRLGCKIYAFSHGTHDHPHSIVSTLTLALPPRRWKTRHSRATMSPSLFDKLGPIGIDRTGKAWCGASRCTLASLNHVQQF